VAAWLDTRTRIRPTTRLAYTRDVELVLIPRLGHCRLSDLDGPLLRVMFAEIAHTTNAKGRPQSPSALNPQIAEGDPKTAAGRRAVALDQHTVAIPREHRRRQLDRRDRRQASHTVWDDSGYVYPQRRPASASSDHQSAI
jgi:hypothetical protein